MLAAYATLIVLALNYGATYFWGGWNRDGISRLTGYAFVLLVTWHVGLLATWVALGKSASHFRLAVAALLGGQIYLDKVLYRDVPGQWHVFLDSHCLAHVLGTVVLLWAAGTQGAFVAPRVTAASLPGKWRLRFSVRQILIGTTAAAGRAFGWPVVSSRSGATGPAWGCH